MVAPYTVPKVIHFPRYNMKCSEESVILRGILHAVSRLPLHVMLYRGNLDCFSDSVYPLIALKYAHTVHLSNETLYATYSARLQWNVYATYGAPLQRNVHATYGAPIQ